MNEQRYGQYLAAFNARNYEGILAFMHPDVELISLGYLIRGHQGIREFYRFFHDYVQERIALRGMVSDERRLYAEGVMTLTGIRSLDEGVLARMELSRFTAVPLGVTVDVELFLHYEIENGLFRTIKASGYLPPQGPTWRDPRAIEGNAK